MMIINDSPDTVPTANAGSALLCREELLPTNWTLRTLRSAVPWRQISGEAPRLGTTEAVLVLLALW